MTGARWLRRFLVVVFFAAPWAWLICFGIFVAAVTYKVGHFPSYSNPDPKHVAGLCMLYMTNVVLLLATFLSPVIVGTHIAVGLLHRRSLRVEPRTTTLYMLAVSLTGLVIFGDAFGLGTWLFD
jgi:hypothetical protein